MRSTSRVSRAFEHIVVLAWLDIASSSSSSSMLSCSIDSTSRASRARRTCFHARLTRHHELLELVEHVFMLDWLDITSFSSSSSQLDRTLDRSSNVFVNLALTLLSSLRFLVSRILTFFTFFAWACLFAKTTLFVVIVSSIVASHFVL